MSIPVSIYFGLTNFVLLFTLLFVLLRRPVRDFFATRATSLGKAIQEAHTAKVEAEKRAGEYSRRLQHIEEEIEKMRREFVEEGELEKRTIITRAEEYAAKQQRDTERMISQELKRAKEHLRGTTVDLAILMAERYLREQITSEDQLRLMRGYVSQLGQLQ